MDEDYRKFGHSLVRLGAALDSVCASMGIDFAADVRVVKVRHLAHQYRALGIDVETKCLRAADDVGQPLDTASLERLEAATAALESVEHIVVEARRTGVGLPDDVVERAGGALHDVERFIAGVLPGRPVIIGRPDRKGPPKSPPPAPAPERARAPTAPGGNSDDDADTRLDALVTSVLKDFDRLD